MTKSFIKKSFLIILIFLMIFAIGCSKKIKYEASYIQVKSKDESFIFELSYDDAVYILAVLNDGEWDPDNTKTGWDYCFAISDFDIKYTEAVGLFNDVTNKRHLIVTEEQRIRINSILDSAKKDNE